MTSENNSQPPGEQPSKSLVRRSPAGARFSPEIFETICDEIAKGRSVLDICTHDAGMPTESAFRGWAIKAPGATEAEQAQLAAKYARAIDQRCDILAEEALNVARGATPETVQVARLDFDAKRWFLGKVSPKKYGDRAAMEVTGRDGGPVELRLVVKDCTEE